MGSGRSTCWSHPVLRRCAESITDDRRCANSATSARLACSGNQMRGALPILLATAAPRGAPRRRRVARRARAGPSRGRPSTCATRETRQNKIGIRGSMPGHRAPDAHVHALPRAVPGRRRALADGPARRGLGLAQDRDGPARRARRRLDVRVRAAPVGRRLGAARRGQLPVAARRAASCSATAASRKTGTRAPRAPSRRTSATTPARSPELRARLVRAEEPRVVRDHAGHAERLERADPRRRRRRSRRRGRRPRRAACARAAA